MTTKTTTKTALARRKQVPTPQNANLFRPYGRNSLGPRPVGRVGRLRGLGKRLRWACPVLTHKVGLGEADTLPRGQWLPGGRTEAPSVSWGCFPPAQVHRSPTIGYARRETGESPASDRRPSQKAKGGDRGPRVNSVGAEAERAGLSTTDELAACASGVAADRPEGAVLTMRKPTSKLR